MRFFCPHCHSQLAKSKPRVCRDCRRDLPSDFYNVFWMDTLWGKLIYYPVAILVLIFGLIIGDDLGRYLGLSGGYALGFFWVLVIFLFFAVLLFLIDRIIRFFE